MPLVAEGPPKMCPRCGFLRPRSDFYARRSPNGRLYSMTLCKEHDKQRVTALQRANAERVSRNLAAMRERRKQDPERLAAFRVYQREWARRKLGITPDRYRVIEGGTGTKSETVDAAPFAACLRRLGTSVHAIGMACGMDPSYVGKLLRGDVTRIELDTVDRALLHANAVVDGLPVTLDTLYPIEEAA